MLICNFSLLPPIVGVTMAPRPRLLFLENHNHNIFFPGPWPNYFPTWSKWQVQLHNCYVHPTHETLWEEDELELSKWTSPTTWTKHTATSQLVLSPRCEQLCQQPLSIRVLDNYHTSMRSKICELPCDRNTKISRDGGQMSPWHMSMAQESVYAYSEQTQQTYIWSGRTGSWTSWAWDITGWSSGLQGKLPIILRGIYRIHPNLIKEKPEDVNMQPVELANTRISTGYAQKSPSSLQQINQRQISVLKA
jgi:hypothetical protein